MRMVERADDAIFVIAEAGVNHDGDPGRAAALVDAAANAGADAVKFQTFRADRLATAGAPKAAYQSRADGDTQLEMLRALELDANAHRMLARQCSDKKVKFLSSPFDLESLAFLVDEIGLDTLKIGSGEITNGPLLLAAARSGRDVILSTGMSTLDEVRDALEILAFGYNKGDTTPTSTARENMTDLAILKDKVTLLHCTSQYPASIQDTNLRAMATLRDAFGLRIGFSDHTPGATAAIAAAALGAAVIEKHFTLDRNAQGPDHAASLEPDQLASMIVRIREVEAALGGGEKIPAASERETRIIARKSLVALQPVRAGETFTIENLGVKRPGGGQSPMGYWDRLGSIAKRDYAADEIIEP
jgi:N-acetylneuraminate synthase